MRHEAKMLTRASLDGTKGKFILATLLFTVATVCAEALGSASVIVSSLVTFVMICFFYNVAKTGDWSISSMITNFFDIRFFAKYIAMSFLVGVICFLGCILFVVPGVIAGLGLSQCFYILMDDKEKGVIECIRESWDIMKGYKFDLWILECTIVLKLLGILVGLIVVGCFFDTLVAVLLIPILSVIVSLFYAAYTLIVYSNYYRALIK